MEAVPQAAVDQRGFLNRGTSALVSTRLMVMSIRSTILKMENLPQELVLHILLCTARTPISLTIADGI